MNLRSSTFTLILSPVEMCSGTCTVTPVDNSAGLVLDVADPPLMDGSVSITLHAGGQVKRYRYVVDNDDLNTVCCLVDEENFIGN